MSRRNRTPKPNPMRRAAVGLSAVVLVLAALAGGVWFGSADRQPAESREGAPQRSAATNGAQAGQSATQPPGTSAGSSMAPAASEAGADEAVSSVAASRDAGATGAEAPVAEAGHGGMDAGEDGASADIVGGAEVDGGESSAERDGTDTETSPDEAIAPEDLYGPEYSDHEPDGLLAAEEGRLGQPALVMFHADWCHVCQEVMPTVHKMREQYKGRAAVLKVNVDHREPVMAKYPVRGTPTFVFFDHTGQVVHSQSGWPGEPLMENYLESALTLQGS